MVGVRPGNDKLVDRARQIVAGAARTNVDMAADTLRTRSNQTPTAPTRRPWPIWNARPGTYAPR
ncbi:hypothetical protein ABT215_44855 [Streptomyces sp900105755]|uniref:hypothetical protein n=1 Tax=Streptomyces sp. 900105755 TaxID=3154389 RepID=UPI003318F6A3